MRLFVIIGALIAVNAAVILYHGDPRRKRAAEGSPPAGSNTAPQQYEQGMHSGPPLSHEVLARHIDRPRWPVQRVARIDLRAQQTAAAALAALHVAPEQAHGALQSLAQHIDFRHLRRGDTLRAHFDAHDRLVELELSRGPMVQARASWAAGNWQGEKPEVAMDTVVAEVVGQVRSSLWDALVGAGEDARLVASLVDIFAYEIDFYSEVRPGDAFSLLVEKRYINGQFVEYGDVTAAEFASGSRVHRAFLHRHVGGATSYYNEAGHSLRKQLLKAPLKYALVTSRFGVRRHPVLGYTRNHNGTDYGVPVGTPVWAVGDGRVLRAGWHGGYGQLVEVVHANGWLSQYAHLSRVDVHPGQRVSQKQTVGLVGQTGLATGPHLHYGLKHHGHFVNALAQRFERAPSLHGEALQLYHARVATLLDNLNKLRVAQEAGGAPLPQG